MRVSVEVAHKVHDLIEGVRFPHHASRLMAYSYSGYYTRLSIGSQEFDSPISRQIKGYIMLPELQTEVGRLVTRQGDELIVGLAFDNDVLPPDTLFRVIRCNMTGDIILRNMGPSLVAKENEPISESPIGVHWGMKIGTVLKTAGQRLFMNAEELEQFNKINASVV